MDYVPADESTDAGKNVYPGGGFSVLCNGTTSDGNRVSSLLADGTDGNDYICGKYNWDRIVQETIQLYEG